MFFCCIFLLALFSKQKIHEIKFAGLEGNDIYNESLDVDIYQNDSDIINSYKCQGYHLKYIMIEIKPNSVEVIDCNFERIALMLTVLFARYHSRNLLNTNFPEAIYLQNRFKYQFVPNDMPSAYINDTSQYVIYEFLATETLCYKKSDFPILYILRMSLIRSMASESMEAVFPISVSKGQRLKISFSFMSETVDKFSYVQIIFTLIISQRAVMSFYNSAVIVFDPIFPILDNDLSPIRTLYDHIAE